MAGDDTTPDSLFKNVLRRPTSATERPRKEEPAPDGGSVSNASVSPPATAAASDNRPSSIGTYSTNKSGHGNSGGESPSVGASKVKKATDFFPNKAHVTDALRTILARLDASDPTLVYEKHMPPSDRNKGQNRLLMSCKCESKRASFASIFTETEMPLVHRPEPLKTEDEEHDNNDHVGKGKGKKKDGGEDNNNKGCRRNNKTKGGSEDGMGEHKNRCGGKADDHEDDDECSVGKEDTDKDDDQQGKQRSTVRGLAVQAYDCDGRAYKLNLKYLSCNTAYRIIGPDWTVFLENNGLLVGGGGVARKRSGRRQKKRRSSLLDEEPNDGQLAVRDADDIQMELWAFRSPKLSIGEKDQPDGALGLLLLHYRGGEARQVRVGGGAAATEELQVAAAPQEVVVVEQPRQNSHGMATQGEDMVAAGDWGVDDAAGKLGALPSTRDMPLCPVERLIAGWLSFLSYDDRSHTDVNGKGEEDANDKQGPN